ncbi:hypothetical protein, partial [Psychrobacter sp. AOP7-B1-24]|uniref:hypothetical protein n=1 Tax=Psychrobacter sp. AOP7-B1-24 TaxID=3457645 RepID=UPI00402BDFA6
KYMHISRNTKKYQKQLIAYDLQLTAMIATIRSERALERKKLASQKTKHMLEENERYMLSKGYDKKEFIDEFEEIEALFVNTADKSVFTENDDLLRTLAVQRLKDKGIEPPTAKEAFVIRHP